MKKTTEKENKELAAQLRKPTGKGGLEIAKVMHDTNASMINNTLDALDILDKDCILELGHGSGNHIKSILQKANNLTYLGLDISELMKEEAEKYCAALHLTKQTHFTIYDGKKVPFGENSVEKIFSINTLYFWEDPYTLLNELYRVLKINGLCCITFITEKAMKGLAFTQYGFEKYDLDKFKKLIAKTGFESIGFSNYSEPITGKLGDLTNREYFVAKLKKSI